MSYRDNFSNLRDTWVGVSNDGGVSFTDGMDMDQTGWILASCPSSGPDAIILGDTIYSVFMNGESGVDRVYFNNASMVAMSTGPSTLMTGSIAGLTVQNYPRISNFGNAVAVVWKQTVSGANEIPILFTYDIEDGFSSVYEIVATESVVSADVVLGDGEIHVVWQNNTDGKVKYRKGTFPGAGITKSAASTFRISPNPSSYTWSLSTDVREIFNVTLTDAKGAVILERCFDASENAELIIENKDLPFGTYFLNLEGKSVSGSISLIRQ